jgi:parvulin-like peptidyl-prolyl isomerase
MKICPKCNKEFEDSINFCTEDHTELEAMDSQEANALAEDEIPVTEELSPTEESDAELEEEEIEASAIEDNDEPEEDEKASPAVKGTATAVAVQSDGMGAMAKGLIVLAVIFALGGGLVFWKAKTGGHSNADFSKITEQEMQVLLKDANPMLLKRLAEEPELKKQQVEQLKQLLAVASQAKKEGMTEEKNIRVELESMEDEIIARSYDQEINKDKGPMPPFGFIGEDRVKEFWGEGDKPSETKETTIQPPTQALQAPGSEANTAPANTDAPATTEPEAANTENKEAAPETATEEKEGPGFVTSALDKIGLGWVVGNADARAHEAEFQQFLDAKLELMKENNPQAEDRKPSDEELKQIRDYFAKVQIYAEEAREKMSSGELGEEFKQKVEIQTKLQQANLLASLYSKKMAEKSEVTDAEIDKYISEHPDLDPAAKKAKAEEILKRAKDGEDFASLANEYSEDPGNGGPDGKKNGGLYENVTKGKMVPEFEAAALALEPGQVSPNLVETQFGYHIIKLDRKGETKDEQGQTSETYDVRHILIMTNAKDPDDPMAKEMPVREMVKAKLTKEKQKKLLDDILANNPVEVPEDFKVPEVSQEQLQQMQQQQMQQQMQQQQMQQPPGGGNAPPPAPKSQPKK